RQLDRGQAGKRFSRAVKRAYDFRCIFSGDRLPKTSATLSAGVEAAHILPWARHQLNVVTNGLCLSKICHWAFDSGVLRLDYAERNNQYIISVPQSLRTIALQERLDLQYFLNLTGPIPRERLPQNPQHWPSPQLLKQLNERMFT